MPYSQAIVLLHVIKKTYEQILRQQIALNNLQNNLPNCMKNNVKPPANPPKITPPKPPHNASAQPERRAKRNGFSIKRSKQIEIPYFDLFERWDFC